MTRLSAVELDAVAHRLTAAGEDLAGPLTAELFTGGRSNLTFRIRDGSQSWVLRMPPRRGRTPSAHDVAREHRVTAALFNAGGPPVARPVLLCDDVAVLGAPFTVAEFVDGRTIQTSAQLDELDDDALVLTVQSLVETLVVLHSVDHNAAGLGGFGKSSDYVGRQLATWSRQWDLVGDAGLAGLERQVRERLARRAPEQRRTAVIHGDYRIDNALLDRETATRVLAVVDWELSTIGDPVADVAMVAAYRHPALDLIVGAPSAWASSRLPDAGGLADAYARTSGHDLPDWRYHQALAHYKVAVIAAGIAHRSREGAGSGAGFETAREAVEPLLRAALDLVAGVQ